MDVSARKMVLVIGLFPFSFDGDCRARLLWHSSSKFPFLGVRRQIDISMCLLLFLEGQLDAILSYSVNWLTNHTPQLGQENKRKETNNPRIDLMVAVTTNTHPRFWDQNPQRPGKYTNHSHQISDSPLYGTQRFSSPPFPLCDFCPATLTLLQEMRDLTDGVKATLSREIGRGAEFEIVNAAASIYRRAFLGVPFETSCNARDVQRMCELLEDETCDETWVRYPGVLMWILLVGVAAGKRSGERSFLTMFFYRVGTTAVWWGMEECTQAVMTFLRVKRAAER